MSKNLKVITPFFNLEEGDVINLSEDGSRYEIENIEEFDKTDGCGDEIASTFTSKLTLSPSYVKELLKEGYLEEVLQPQQKFVNIFEEIDNLLSRYNNELNEVKKDTMEIPECLKVEKTTVLTNMIKVLTHLKNLKK